MCVTGAAEGILGLKEGIIPRPARPRQELARSLSRAQSRGAAEGSTPEFWSDHPEVKRGAVTWQLTRQYGPHGLAQLLRMQRFMDRLAKI
jgi:hypothetical protein